APCATFPAQTPALPSRSQINIDVIFGPMFSGKSTELLRRVRRFQIARYDCLVIKYSKDTRYSNTGIATHDRNMMEAVPASKLKDVYQKALSCRVIGIDEGQFFPDIVEFCEDMANRGKAVIVAALDGTFQRKPFGSILNLVPLAESVVKLNAVCMECFKEASYTKRLGTEEEVEVIGGAEKYHAVCRVCHLRKPEMQTEDKENWPIARKDETLPHVQPGRSLDPKVQRTRYAPLLLSQS
uniref:Thymidine kinase n=1 Tax=Latimeria chalumnae TaxID=7897 RepID=H3B914_LATCH